MTTNRRYALAGIVLVLGIVTGAILLEVLETVLFALTVAYVLLPVCSWLERRGLSRWTAGVLATLVGFLGAVAVFSPLVATLYFQRSELVAVLEQLPAELTVTAFETDITLEAVEVKRWAISQVQSIAVSFATAAPELAVKLALFVLLLFAILLEGDAAARAAIAPIPPEYRDVAHALARRARETLYAIYVLQLATSVATFLVSYPLFWVLGYDAAFTLSLIAAVLQFVPIIGPSLLVVPIALYHVAVGELVAGILVGVLGIVLIGWLPDVVVRPRLARRSAGLPGSLYFVGFTGGLFTLGAIGIVVGPLLVAVFVEAVSLLAEEVHSGELEAFEEAGEEPDPPVSTAFEESAEPGAGID